jgi:hypothetical protein
VAAGKVFRPKIACTSQNKTHFFIIHPDAPSKSYNSTPALITALIISSKMMRTITIVIGIYSDSSVMTWITKPMPETVVIVRIPVSVIRHSHNMTYTYGTHITTRQQQYHHQNNAFNKCIHGYAPLKLMTLG